MEVFFILRNDTPQKLVPPRRFRSNGFGSKSCQRLEYTPVPGILQATAERQRIEFFAVDTNTGYLAGNFITSMISKFTFDEFQPDRKCGKNQTKESVEKTS
jgi:hypothetical protein